MNNSGDFAPTELLGSGEGGRGGEAHGAGGHQNLDIRFTGSGSEYFRIWIVNLLLILVTLSLYWPFARARRIAYFQNNTVVGGHALGFHADPWKMFRGYLVVLAFSIAYTAVSELAPGMSWLPILFLAALWPALWRASLHFRLRNTSWRGVRMAFNSPLAGAYGAFVPFYVLALLYVVSAPSSILLGPAVAIGMGLLTLLAVLMLPWFVLRLKRYQHGGYAYAGEQTRLDLPVRSFYGLSLKSMGVLVLGAAALVALGFAFKRVGSTGPLVWVALLAGLYLLTPLVLLPYTTVRLQNLIWSNTSSPRIRIHSQLRFVDYFKINALNWLLILVTLGFYWPFAKVRAARARLEAITLEVPDDVDAWVAQAQSRKGGVLGDAAGDFFGFDMGL